MARLLATSLLVFAACAPAGEPTDTVGNGGGKEDRADSRPGDILSTTLKVDLATRHANAILEVKPDGDGRLELDVHGLAIKDVTAPYELRDGRLLLERLPATARVGISYDFGVHDQSDGLLPSGVTLIWPYHCGNVFPCHSDPGDGMVFDLQLENVPEGQVAIFPDRIETDAPSYMLAWAVGNYGHEALGATSAGTRVNVFWLPGGKTNALAGTRHLTEVFDWLERTLGPYAFGHEVGSVSAKWGAGALGGMEHHPFWHVADEAMDDEETHAHEAAHGWYGDGVRIRCWEDFVLSEGTVSYLAARALGQVAGEDVEKEVWEDYQQRLEDAGPGIAWPHGCNQVDIIKDGLFSDLPYMRGAFFYKEVAAAIGAETLDQVLGSFYRDHRGQAAGFFDILVAIENETGFDAGPLAMKWLRTR